MIAIRFSLLALFSLFLTCTSCAAMTAPQTSQQAVSIPVDRSLHATIVLYTQDDKLICAGQRISPTKVLTAWHCVAAAIFTVKELEEFDEAGIDLEELDPSAVLNKRLRFATYAAIRESGKKNDPVTHVGRVIKVDKKHDLALLETKLSPQPAVNVRGSRLSAGEEIYSIGHPAGYQFTYAHGHVAASCRYLSGFEDCWTQVDITSWGGSSGGGLYDMSGNLVGVCSRGPRSFAMVFFTAPFDIAQFVNS